MTITLVTIDGFVKQMEHPYPANRGYGAYDVVRIAERSSYQKASFNPNEAFDLMSHSTVRVREFQRVADSSVYQERG